MTDTDIRGHFHDELRELESDIVKMGQLAEKMVGEAVDAHVNRDNAVAESVIMQDNAMDELFSVVHQNWLELVARQSPVASDLRLAVLILHVNTTLERMGDQAVNIAKIHLATEELPHSQPILQRTREMGDLVLPMIRLALEALIQRDEEAARRLPAMDDPVDDLNRGMYHLVVDCAADQHLLEWATRMMMVARALERVGDQAVDIGEQVAFLLSGEFQEWT